jgi:hypothetical protein
LIIELEAKFVPDTATCNPEHALLPVRRPAGTLVMVTPVIVGTGGVTVSGVLPLVDPPGPGLLTVRDPTLAFCRSAALKTTCNVVTLTKVVVRADPFHNTTELASKPVPVSTMVAAAPAATSLGEIDVTTGDGLDTSNSTALDAPPPGTGFDTVTIATELLERLVAGNEAFISLELTSTVERAAPFQFTTDDGTKPAPAMSIVVAPDPAVTLAGSIDFTTGGGLSTVKVAAADTPPPGDGLETVTAAIEPFIKSAAGTVAAKAAAEVNVVFKATPLN